MLFMPLIMLLFIVQLFIIKQGNIINLGSNIIIDKYELFGMSYSSTVSILIIIYCMIKIISKNNLKLVN